MTTVRLYELRMEDVPSVAPGIPLTLDLSETRFAYPSGMVALMCLARDASSLAVQWPLDRNVANYLSRMRLDHAVRALHPGVAPLAPVRHLPANLCEISPFEGADGVTRLADMVGLSAANARLRAEVCWALEEGAWELCDNAITHAEWSGGGVYAAQHYRERNEIEYAVGDAGVGLLQSLQPHYPEIADDASAIMAARSEGVTRFGRDRRGAGLTETVNQVVALGGRVVIRSGQATVTFDRPGARTASSGIEWTGTLVKAVIPLG